MVYLYESHTGGLYLTDEYLDNELLYCETCGDSDMLLDTYDTPNELAKGLRDMLSVFNLGGYSLEYLESIYTDGCAIFNSLGYSEEDENYFDEEESVQDDEEIEVNKYHVNAKIKGYILDEDKMQSLNFRLIKNDDNDVYWYMCRTLQFPKKYKSYEITFNISIYDNPNNIEIDVLDEDFLQPYDYQRVLKNSPNFEFALLVREQVEDIMTELQDTGIITGHIRYEYI